MKAQLKRCLDMNGHFLKISFSSSEQTSKSIIMAILVRILELPMATRLCSYNLYSVETPFGFSPYTYSANAE
jgi:hypothetical protein